MGLDLALGGLVLISAIRGWLKGFLIQAIKLGGLVASVYVAVPVRDQVKPYVLEYLPTMRPELIDRMLWWASAVVSYFVIVGVASLAIAVSRRQTFGIAEPKRGDQFAGLSLGMVKGLIAASFLVAALQRYAQPHIIKVDWAEEQVKTSLAWDWNERYHPAAQIWAAPPVQRFVNHIQKMGLMAPAGQDAEVPEKPLQTASRIPSLTIPSTRDRVFSPPRRPKLVLRQPFDARKARQKASGKSGKFPDLGEGTQGPDPELLRQVESLKTQLDALDVNPGLDTP